MYEVEMMPPEMKAYLRNYGYSFSKKACEFAVSHMRRENKSTGKMEKIESIEDEEHLAKHVKAIIDDIDENPENLFRMWIAKMDGNGIPIPWEDIL